jgi:diacylglycerol kinase
MNTAIEDLVDLVSPEFDKKAGRIKDISAGAVLAAAIIATVVAVYIFGNKIFSLLF